MGSSSSMLLFEWSDAWRTWFDNHPVSPSWASSPLIMSSATTNHASDRWLNIHLYVVHFHWVADFYLRAIHRSFAANHPPVVLTAIGDLIIHNAPQHCPRYAHWLIFRCLKAGLVLFGDLFQASICQKQLQDLFLLHCGAFISEESTECHGRGKSNCEINKLPKALLKPYPSEDAFLYPSLALIFLPTPCLVAIMLKPLICSQTAHNRPLLPLMMVSSCTFAMNLSW